MSVVFFKNYDMPITNDGIKFKPATTETVCIRVEKIYKIIFFTSTRQCLQNSIEFMFSRAMGLRQKQSKEILRFIRVSPISTTNESSFKTDFNLYPIVFAENFSFLSLLEFI